MNYHFRILPAAEYPRLGLMARYLPVDGLIGVVEDDGVIIGRWMAGSTTILEGLEIHPAHRKNPIVVRLLFQGMLDALRAAGVPAALTLVQTGDVVKLAFHAEFEYLPGLIFQKDLRKGNG
jgi:hypothetical protein